MPNREKGISVIAGAAEVRLVANQVLAGERGIVVAGAGTTHISMQRNVVASQGQGLVGIEVREAHFVTLGGEFGLGNSIAGVQVGILLVDVEEAVVADNSIGRDFARLGFSAALETGVGIELGAGVRAATVERNSLGGLDGPAITVTGRNARDNRFTRNVFGTNAGLDIDLGGDGPTPNDEGDRDSGPHGLLNTPVIESYHVEREASGRLRSVIRGRGLPGATVEVYSADPEQRTFWARGRVGADGRFQAVTLVVPVGEVRAINVANVGGTSEFSAPFPAPARQHVAEGQHWLAIVGDEQPVGEAFEQLGSSLEVVWHWDPVARTVAVLVAARTDGPRDAADRAGRRCGAGGIRTESAAQLFLCHVARRSWRGDPTGSGAEPGQLDGRVGVGARRARAPGSRAARAGRTGLAVGHERPQGAALALDLAA